MLSLNWKRHLPNTIFICPNGHETCEINPSGYQWFDLTKDDPDYILNESLIAEKKIIKFLEEIKEEYNVKNKNIENENGNLTRFLVMGKDLIQPEFTNKQFITSFLFKLKSKPAALYQSLGGFAINGVNLTKLQSYPEKNSFDSYFFLCDLDGHIEDPKVQKSLEELGLHCEDFHVLGVFEADKLRQKNKNLSCRLEFLTAIMDLEARGGCCLNPTRS